MGIQPMAVSIPSVPPGPAHLMVFSGGRGPGGGGGGWGRGSHLFSELQTRFMMLKPQGWAGRGQH